MSSAQINLTSTKFQISLILIVGGIALFLVIMFISIPALEERDQQLYEIRNTMSCGDLKQMILDKSGLTVRLDTHAEHQFKWMCEK